MYSVWAGGFHGTQIAPHSAPTWEMNAVGGCGELKMVFDLRPGSEHQALRRNSPVRVMIGTHSTYWGRLVDYNHDTGEMVAEGEFGRNKLALDGDGNATRDLGVAIAAAIDRGWNVSNPAGVGGVAHGDSTGVQTVADLATEVANQTEQWVGINGRGQFYMSPAPTTPRWMLAPGTVALARTAEGMAEFLAGRWFDGSDYQTETAGTLTGDEEAVDLTARGVIDDVQARAILRGVLGKTRGRFAWAGGAEVSNSRIATIGGTPAALADVRPLSIVRIPGLPVYSAGSLWLDEVIGKTRYTAGSTSIYLEPISTAPRDLASVIAAS